MMTENANPSPLKRYVNYVKKCRGEYKSSLKISLDEIYEDLKQFSGFKDSKALMLIMKMSKDWLGSGLWISYSYYRYLKSFFDINSLTPDFLRDPLHQEIINAINDREPILNENVTLEDIFTSVFMELRQSYTDPYYTSRLKVNPINCEILLVPGVLNELFKYAPFERGTQELCKHLGLNYTISKIHGLKSSKNNAKTLTQEIDGIYKKTGKKVWVLAYSKGGLDTLYTISKNQEMAREKIQGLTAIASPILGTEHTENKLVRLLYKFDKIPFIKKLDKSDNIFDGTFQKSISSQYQSLWLRENIKKFPTNLFYTSIALQSDFKGSHFWMMLAKILFKSKKKNDGVVNIDETKFPEYFPAFNFGSVQGHHLAGSRSSSFSQEALLMAHVVLLQYFNKFD